MADQTPPPSGLLDFFVLEGGDYLEQLDLTLARATTEGPDREGLTRLARALRGSATMARLPEFADLASAFERVVRGVKEGAVDWTPSVHATLVGAVDEMKVLLHHVRDWGDPERDRAGARAAELSELAPAGSSTGASKTIASGADYLAGELSNLGAGLELLLTSPAAAAGLGQVLQRVRTLRGVAGIRDLPRLPEVLDAAERALGGAERGARSAAEAGRGVLESSAALLRDLSTAMREGRTPSIRDAVSARFEEAFDAWESAERAESKVIPVESLFFDDDGPSVVQAAPSPPSNPRQRFVVEAVGQTEHLRQVVAEARKAVAAGDGDRAARAVRDALRGLRETAESFSQRPFADAVKQMAGQLSFIDERLLDRLESIAARVISSGPEPEAFREDAAPLTGDSGGEVAGGPELAIPEERGAEPLAEVPLSGDAPAAAFAEEPLPSMADLSLQGALDRGIGSLEALGDTPLVEASPLPEVPVVPVESLLYRGRSALDRAAEIREELARRGGGPGPEELEEIFDLIELARAS
jgi:HPt (histidine-containing phosphotransfer) domain-containing protein